MSAEAGDALSRFGLTEHTIRAAQRRDVHAMSRILDALLPYLGRICESIALSEGADATQEALISVFQNLPSLREPRALIHWATRIATREAVRVARRRLPVVNEQVFVEIPAGGDPYAAIEVRAVLERLSPDHRAILVLREYADLEEAAIAELLGISLGTVKSRLHRARASFRREWQT